jgi:hypothetical protein
MPRLDYSNGSCPSLLLEPSRTNLIEDSEYYGDLAPTRITLTSNYGISPEGVQNAAAIFNTTELGRHNLNGAYFSVTSGTSYVNSVFAKAGTITKMQLRMFSGGGTSIGFNDGVFDLTNGTATGTGAGIESYGNGWYRCYVIDSPTSSVSNARFNIELLDANGDISYVGSVTDYIEVFGSQVEEGSYPTSYIPTYGVSQTRLAESCVVNNATSSIGQTEGTIFLDFVYDNNGGGFYGSFVANATGFTDFVGWRIQDNKTALDILIRYNNTFQVLDNIASVFAVGNRYKVALKYSSGDIKVFVNNQEKFSSTATYTTPNVPLSKHTISGATLNLVDSLQGDTISKVNQSILFPTALSDEACIELTTI